MQVQLLGCRPPQDFHRELLHDRYGSREYRPGLPHRRCSLVQYYTVLPEQVQRLQGRYPKATGLRLTESGYASKTVLGTLGHYHTVGLFWPQGRG